MKPNLEYTEKDIKVLISKDIKKLLSKRLEPNPEIIKTKITSYSDGYEIIYSYEEEEDE
jgi:hypothetical protein